MKRRLSEEQALLRMGRHLDREDGAAIKLAEQLLFVRDRAGSLCPLVANAAQRCFEQRRGQNNIVLKARQMGITTWIAARFFLRTITHTGQLTLQVAHTREAAESIFRVVQRMWENLPTDMREGPLRRSRANVGQMVFPEIDSEYRVGSACDENAGRGLSLQSLHCSEVSRWPGDAAATLAGLRAALAPDGELMLESTPNGAYGAFYAEWTAAVDAAEAAPDGALVRHFLPWWMEPTYVGPRIDPAAMTTEECALVVRHRLTSSQIGFRRSLERSYGALRSQEFAEDADACFRATGACCFEVAAIEARLAELPPELDRRRGGALLVWLPPLHSREYIVAVDTAGGGEDGDFAALQVVETATGLQCAELQQRLRPAELARAAAELAREYGDALVAVERNNHGAAVLAYLESRERYTHLYRQNGLPGWLTTVASKPDMIARLGVLLEQTPQCFMSRRLLGECRTFVAAENGRAAAAAGAHDDLVMAMAIAQAVCAEIRTSGARSTKSLRRVA